MNKNTLNLGLILGVLGIVLFMLMVVTEPGMVMSFVFTGLGLLMAVVVPIIFLRRERTENGGTLSFGAAFKLSFIGLLIGGGIGLLFQMLYVHVIDPEYAEGVITRAVEMTAPFLESLGDEEREQILRETEERTRNQFTIGGQLMYLGIAAIVYAVISLILAAIFKRNPDGSIGSETLDG